MIANLQLEAVENIEVINNDGLTVPFAIGNDVVVSDMQAENNQILTDFNVVLLSAKQQGIQLVWLSATAYPFWSSFVVSIYVHAFVSFLK